jgi:carbonic anhydrase
MCPLHQDPTAHPTPGSPPGVPKPGARPGPDQVLAELISGNRRFLAGHPDHGHQVASAVAAANDRSPSAVVLGCMDARVPVEAVFDQDFGAVCVTRSAGHVLDRAALASMDLAVSTLGVRLVMVLGHRRCLAVAAALDARRTGRHPAGYTGFVVDEIGRSITSSDLSGDDPVEVVTRRHVVRTVAQLRAALVTGRSGTDGVRVAGAVYDVDTGRVDPL